MKFLNPHDIILIAVVVILVHILAKPLYRVIDSASASAPDPS